MHTNLPTGTFFVYCIIKFKKVLLNYTLSQLRDRVNDLIKVQGEDAHCAAWIYTKEDCYIRDEDGEVSEYPCDEHPFLANLIMEDVGNIDYIYTLIQECVDESTEEHYVQYQQELV